jgi:hypothetical protein
MGHQQYVAGEARFASVAHVSSTEATTIAGVAARQAGCAGCSTPVNSEGVARGRQRRTGHQEEQLVALWNTRTDDYRRSPREPDQFVVNAADSVGGECRRDVGRAPSRAWTRREKERGVAYPTEYATALTES